ncbi:HAD domain-containing protein [Hydrogenophaga pseudoflava]|uniref:HAD domain-containing protein n=1 Tax=Hydrogenophaga pseudoflava TaxID=47421 RepID=UPI0027E55CE2|nr:HAD domain-containing protein [Hydrogenophaga pseudoflava]MDQ7747479.1 HAD domain-containing protein [Hydrogenophaga pseudoflava]
MRLIFLDFDGVLHPLEPESLGLEKFCWLPVLTSLLSGHDDVQIVVHSTWRYEYTNPELRALLGPLGMRFAGSAPRAPREQAIETVLQANRAIQHHLVLDDDAREFSGTAVNLLLLDSQRGISDEQAQADVTAWLLSTATPEATAQGRDT